MRILSHLACLEIHGGDRKTYLQGQLSNDLMLLTAEQGQLACCNSSQGRVQCILYLIERDEAVLAIVPSAMLDGTLQRLRRYVLRSKVTVHERSPLQLAAATAAELAAANLPAPEQLLQHVQQGATSVLRWNDPVEARWLVIQPADATRDEAAAVRASQTWQLADIRAGLPQVLPPTHETFVAQMLNLDALGGISFNKGCYTGQEIIARAHFRGTVKRRMFRFAVNAPAPEPGTRVLSGDQHAGEVVHAIGTPGGAELLAVISLSSAHDSLCLETPPDIRLQTLTLPYAIQA